MIKPFTLENGTIIYVEVDETALPPISSPNANLPSDLPPGAEPTSVLSSIIDTSKLLKDTICGTAQSVLDSLKGLQPDEWSVEINIGMKADSTNIIPVLVKGEGEGSIKVTATWKKG